MDVEISVIIPAFDEAIRLPPYLDSIRRYFADVDVGVYEIIVVNDGSRDDSADVFARICRDWPQLRVLSHSVNQGKGQSIRAGMLAARGELMLVTDADGATPIRELLKFREAIEGGADLAIGSRVAGGDGVFRRRSSTRACFSRPFAWLARMAIGYPIRDSQCGFKMFRRPAALTLVPLCQQRRYLLDVELLSLASSLGYRIVELPVSWTDVPGSKLNLILDGCEMALGLAKMTIGNTARRRSHDG